MEVLRDIRCQSCGLKGKIRAANTEGLVPEDELFEILGKDEKGFLHFQCPVCRQETVLDPYDLLGVTPPPMEILDPVFRRVRRNRTIMRAISYLLLWSGILMGVFGGDWLVRGPGILLAIIGLLGFGLLRALPERGGGARG